tara:strand:+ start:1151 stop:1369 length:219 start_codon:yes stop_codon:yes gene_type:complete
MTTVTKQDRVIEGLRKTKTGLTAKQIEARYNVGNARATVSALRNNKGFVINTVESTDSRGRSTTRYLLKTTR